MMKNNLDQDVSLSLDEPIPEQSSLNQIRFQEHRQALHKQELLISSTEPLMRKTSLVLYQILSVLSAVLIILILLWGVMDLPTFGQAANPAENEVSERYLSMGLAEGGATNLVANMILDYRAFDTLGESNVLFTAACTVILLLHCFQPDGRDSSLRRITVPSDPEADPVLRGCAKALGPVILLFGLYIILNGHLGPGGGFSGGAVMSAGLILFRAAYGQERISHYISFRFFQRVTMIALSFYVLSKAYSFFTGGNGLQSFISLGIPGDILSAGLILPLNIAVGFVVCCTMYGFFSLFEKGGF